MGYIYAVGAALVGGLSQISQKLWQRKTYSVENAFKIYMVMMSVCACAIFYISSGCNVVPNGVTLAFSVAYALIVALSLFLTFLAMKKMNLVTLAVFSKGSTVLVWLFGIIVMKDTLSLKGVLSSLMLLAAIGLIPLENNEKPSVDKGAFVVGILLLTVSAVGSVLLKLYTMYPERKPNSVLFFYTNVFTAVIISIEMIVKKERLADYIADMKRIGRYHILILLSTIFSNGASLLSLMAIELLPLSVQAVISTALNNIVVFVNSRLVLREDGTITDVIAFLLSTVAVLINVI